MEHLTETQIMQSILDATNGERRELVEVAAEAVIEKGKQVIKRLRGLNGNDFTDDDEEKLLTKEEKEARAERIKEKRSTGYLELFSMICKAEEMEEAKLQRERGELLSIKRAVPDHPAAKKGKIDAVVDLSDIEEIEEEEHEATDTE